MGRVLLQNSRTGQGKEDLEKSLESLQTEWMKLVAMVEGEREKLESVLNKWRKTEQVVEEISLRLREMRQKLATDICSNYEALQMELLRCKVCISIVL